MTPEEQRRNDAMVKRILDDPIDIEKLALSQPMTFFQFFDALWAIAPSGFIDFRFIPSEEQPSKIPENIYRDVTQLRLDERTIDWLAKKNETHHIYHRINLSKEANGKKIDMKWAVALWADLDNCDNWQQFETPLGERLPMLLPNIIVRSGGGYHGYWLLNEPLEITDETRPQIECVLSGIALHLGGDVKVKDVGRILRTPEFKNIKSKYGENKPVAHAYEIDLSCRYTFSELHRAFAHLGTPMRHYDHIPEDKRTPEMRDYLYQNLPRYVKDYLQHGAGEGERNATLYACARAYNDSGYSEHQANGDLGSRASADGLPQHEIRACINSAYRNMPSPSLPKKMQRKLAW